MINYKNFETITLAGGCFWCTEAIYKELNGVESVMSGYAGGIKKNPTYEEICTGSTGYAESIQIKFSSQVLSLKDLLRVFFKTHDPTTLNRQGNDVGNQYRSAIFYQNEEQKKVAEEVKKEIEEIHYYTDPIVTEIEAYTNFYKAEDYHQDFYANHQNQPYCKIIIDPKIKKLRKEFSEKLKNN